MKIKKLFLILFFLGLGIWGAYRFFLLDILYPYNKEFKKFVIESSSPIENIDPKNETYDGFDKIASAIGDSRVVFLGEQDHGDAPTFLAKTKIIKYLHEKMGFNVLVFESNFLGLNRSLANAEELRFSTSSQYKDFIFPIWTNCRECSELFNYIDSKKSTDNPILISGMDPQVYSSEEGPFPIDYLISDLARNNVFRDSTEWKNITRSLRTLVQDDYEAVLNPSAIDSLESFFKIAESKLKPDSYLHQSLRSFRGFALSALDTSESNNARDAQMSDNFLWLKDHVFSEEKILVWASNSHLFKGYRDLPYSIHPSDSINAGTLIADKIEDELYVLGFTSNRGKAGRLYKEKYDLSPPNRNSFEAFIEETDVEYAFIDFKANRFDENRNQRFWMKSITHSPNNFYWTKMFDGIFYIEEMYPCSDVLGIDQFAIE